MDQQQKVAELIVRFGKKVPLNGADLRVLHNHLTSLRDDELSDILEKLMEDERLQKDLPNIDGLDKERTYHAIVNDPRYRADAQNRSAVSKRIAIQPILRWAAVFVVFISVALLVYQQLAKQATPTDIMLAIQGASPCASILLPDGRRIDMQDGQREIILRDGQIYYQDGTLVVNHIFAEHEQVQLSTPKGGVYAVTLTDGTKIQLNAESSLAFPIVFEAHLRQVNLIGEAYFDVQKGSMKSWPFEVHSTREIARVLGTTFNISAYPDEQNQVTTLYTGKLAVKDKLRHTLTLLKPKEQVSSTARSIPKTMIINNSSESDWTQGMFVFHDKKLGDIAPQLARWYDVDIHFEGGTENEVFDGTIPRSKDLQEILQLMEMTGTVHCRVDGRKISISPTR